MGLDVGLLTRGVIALERMATALEQIAATGTPLTPEEEPDGSSS